MEYQEGTAVRYRRGTAWLAGVVRHVRRGGWYAVFVGTRADGSEILESYRAKDLMRR
jgi:hypothetical protein